MSPNLVTSFPLLLPALLVLCGSCAATTPVPEDAAPSDASAGDAAIADAMPVDAEPVDAPPTCSGAFGAPMRVGELMDPMLTEVSGAVASSDHDGVIWVHNDSGDGPRTMAIDLAGARLAEATIPGAPAFDIEDIAIERRDGVDRLWLGDVGDNDARDGGSGRREVHVVRIDEPDPRASPTIRVGAFDDLVLTYPDRPHDCEGILVDSESGDLYLFAKENTGTANVYVLRAPAAAGRHVLELAGSIALGSSPELPDGSITGADLSADARFVAVRTYGWVMVYARAAAMRIEEALAAPTIALLRTREAQGEAVCFSAEGDVVTMSEGRGTGITRYPRCAP